MLPTHQEGLGQAAPRAGFLDLVPCFASPPNQASTYLPSQLIVESMAAVITWVLALLSGGSSGRLRCGLGMEDGLRGLVHIVSSFSAVFTTTQARKSFWDYFSQNSQGKGMMGQQQKLAQE